MPTSQKAKLKLLSMRTSKRVVHTEAARAPVLNHLTNAPDLKTDLVTGVATTGIETMMTVEATGEVAVAPTSDLEDGVITEEVEEGVDIAADVGEGIMIEGIIAVEGEVMVYVCGGEDNNKVLIDAAIFIIALNSQIVFCLIFAKRDGHHLQSSLGLANF